MWDYDTRKVGGGGGAEERWDLLPGRRGEDEKERRGGGWGRGGGAAAGGGGAKNAAQQRSELKDEERRKWRLANSVRLNASPPVRPLRGSEDCSPTRVICFLPEFGARQTATRLRREAVDSCPGFGTAPHSGTERSTRDPDPDPDPARPLSPLLISSPPGFPDLSSLFCFTEDVNNAQRRLSSFDLERSTPTRVFHPAGFLDLKPLLAVAMGPAWMLVGALAVILTVPPGIHGWYFLLLKQLSGCYVGQGLSGSSSRAEMRWDFVSLGLVFPPSVGLRTE